MFAVLGIGDAVGRLIGFAGTIYVARRLGVESYGIVAVSSAAVLYFAQLVNFSVELLGAREIARRIGRGTAHALDGAQSRSLIAEFVPPLLAARSVIALGCMLLLGAFALTVLPQPDGTVLAMSTLSLLAVAGSTKFAFVGLERPGSPAASGLVGELLALALMLATVHQAADLATVPLNRAIGEGTSVLLMLVVLRRQGFALSFRRHSEVVRPLFTSAVPLVAHALLGLAIFNSDLLFLRALRDARTAGMYAAAYTLVSFLLNLGVTYGTSILPSLSRERDHPERLLPLYDQAMMQVLVVALPIAVGGAMLAPGLLTLVFGAQFGESVRPLQILMWSIVVAWVRNVVQMGLVARDQQALVLRATLWSAAANVALNLLLIPAFGMIGAATATLATETLRTGVALRFAQRMHLPFGVRRRLWRPLVASAGMGVMLWWAPFAHVSVAIVAGALCYGALLILTGGIRRRDGRVHVAL